jgi:hypothetical protein
MSIVGQTARIVGFGRTSLNDMSGDHVKHYGTDVVSGLDSNWVSFDMGSMGEHECKGDSGGPALLDLGCGPAVIGTVNRHTDSACEVGLYQRVDIEQSFVMAQIHTVDPGFMPAPCTPAPPDGGGSSSGSSTGSSSTSSGSSGASSGSSSGGLGTSSGVSSGSSGSTASGSSSTGSSGGSSGGLPGGSSSGSPPGGDDAGNGDFGGVQASAGCSCGVVGAQGPTGLPAWMAASLLGLAACGMKRGRKIRSARAARTRNLLKDP